MAQFMLTFRIVKPRSSDGADERRSESPAELPERF